MNAFAERTTALIERKGQANRLMLLIEAKALIKHRLIERKWRAKDLPRRSARKISNERFTEPRPTRAKNTTPH